MQITLSSDEFQGLSESARNEILEILLYRSDLPEPQSTSDKGQRSGLIDMTPAMVAQFMQGLSFLTRDRLRMIAENGGRATWEYLDEFSDGELNQGFQSGVTRRIRKVTGDAKATLLGWREGYDDKGVRHLECGEYFVSPATQRALMGYFAEFDAEAGADD